MSHSSFKLARRIARLRVAACAALILALAACDNNDTFTPDSSTPPDVVDEGLSNDPFSAIEEDTPIEEEDAGITLTAVSEPTVASASFSGGIPIGHFHQPYTTIGSRYNGTLRTLSPSSLMSQLSEIKARGGRVMLSLSGSSRYYRDGSGHFSMSKWKGRLDRFRSVSFAKYITDGTIIGHYLLDEPNDPSNWSGRVVSGGEVEEMARYSKQLWPGMATIVRAEPGYMAKFSTTYRYLDAAWAQYVHRKGSASDYIRRNLADAQKKGLGLVVGLNVLKGGPNGSKMTATQVKDWGSTMLSSTYSCAFLSWEYNSSYLSSSSIESAMSALRTKAQSRSSKSCRS